jgi:hypothetical protein
MPDGQGYTLPYTFAAIATYKVATILPEAELHNSLTIDTLMSISAKIMCFWTA